MKKTLILISALLMSVLGFSANKIKAEIHTINSYANGTYPLSSLNLDKNKDKLFKNRRQKRPIGVNIMGLGPAGVAGVSIDGFLGPKFAIEAGAGIRSTVGDFNYFIGGRYHFLGGTRLSLTPYVGLYTSFHNTGRKDVQNNSIYIPVGINRIKKNGFSWSAELGYRNSMDTDRRLHGAFKIGYRF